MIPYAWYLQRYRPDNVDDSGNGSAPMSEDYWNQLTPSQQSQIVQSNTMGMDNQTDPGLMGRYNAAVGAQGDPTRGLTLVQPGWLERGNMFNDPSRVFTDPVTGAQWTNAENMSPHSQDNDGRFGSRPWLTGIATVLGAGMLNNYAMTGSAFNAPGGAPDFSNVVGGSSTTAGNTPGGWTGLGDSGGLDPETWVANGPGGPDTYGPWGANPTEGTPIDPLTRSNITMPASPPGFGTTGFSLTDPSSWGSGLLSAVTSNPLQALGLIQAGRGLLGNNTKPSGSGNDSKGGDGGSGAPANVSRGQFTPNPYTQAQIQNYQPVIPGRY